MICNRPLRRALACAPLLLAPFAAACSSTDEAAAPAADAGTSSDADVEAAPSCSDLVLEGTGSPDGHADPLGARAAGQARAGRIHDAAQIVQPDDARQRVRVGDFLLANDKVAVYVEDRGLSDGYARFGGELLAIDKVGDDGRPLGLSHYGETLVALSTEMIHPTSITVTHDGSDGQAASVRVVGPLESVPFFGSLKAFFPRTYGLDAAYDYVLEPHAERVLVRLSVLNRGAEAIEIGRTADHTSDEMHGFFQYSRQQMWTTANGYAEPSGDVPWVGFDGGEWGFAWRKPAATLEYGLTVSGFAYFLGKGFTIAPCSVTTVDHAEVIAGGPWLDGLREAIRRTDGDTSWRTITGAVHDASGAPVAGAWVHELATDGTYLSRTKSDAQGAFSLHAPPGAVRLVARERGWPVDDGVTVAAGVGTAAITLGAPGFVHVQAKDALDGTPLPVRVQVIADTPAPPTPDAFGDEDEDDGRLHQEFAVTGDVTLPVPPGGHTVVVSRGYEWELHQETVHVAAGETAEVRASLEHSVDSTGVLCADFHIHSFFSADSSDPVEHKVKGAIADGLDLPVSSEHEWVIDFQPTVEKLGLTKWARGFSSEELTTFAWGHFGVVPLTPHEDRVNAGAVEWIGKNPPEVFATVHALPEDPALIVNHPSGGSFAAYFSAAGFTRATATGTAGLWSDAFDAIEVFNSSSFDQNRKASVADWFSLLEHDRVVWAVGSSDSHQIRSTPVGYPRTCLEMGHDDLARVTGADLRDTIKSGRATVSGGLLLSVVGPGGERPGQTVVAPSGEAIFSVTVQAPSWVDAQTLETIVNGKTVSTEPLVAVGTGVGKRFVQQVTVPVDALRATSWVVFHAKGAADLSPLHPGKLPFAMSNPIFVTGG